MDITDLQDRLRAFAAERGWEPFHTPKNLATALGVEVAELAEVFQWLTPEQSQAIAGDALLAQRVADEAADVLLYLVQLCDHTGVDLDDAVEHKLARNASRHPPPHPGRPAAARTRPQQQVHALVDWENVQPREDELRDAIANVTHVWLFHGPQQRHVDASYGSFGERVTPVCIARTGKNALDFHLTFYIGYIAARHPDAAFVVVSNDQGYAPMIEHAVQLGFDVRLEGFSRSTAPARRGSRKTAAARTGAAGKAAAKNTRSRGGAKAVPETAAAAPAPGKRSRRGAATSKSGSGAATSPAQPDAGTASPVAKKAAKTTSKKAAKVAKAAETSRQADAAATPAAGKPTRKRGRTATLEAAAPAAEAAAPAPATATATASRGRAAKKKKGDAAAGQGDASPNGMIALALMAEPPGRRSPNRKGLLRFIRRLLPDGGHESTALAALDALQAAGVVALDGQDVRYLR